MTGRRRLDVELVRRKIAPSRAQAQELIDSGKVTVSGAIASNAARQVHPGDPIELVGPRPRYVSRGGEKLHAALEEFKVKVSDARTLDVGASTGGFTDCMLQHGVASVVALDVGHGQLHERMRAHEQVDVRERMNIREASLADLGGEPFDVITVDVSFISLRTIAPALIALAGDKGDIIALVKPQFEAGRHEVSKGRGVVRDSTVWQGVLEQVLSAMEAHGAARMGLMVSPLLGAEGNVEFLAWFRLGAEPEPVDIDSVVAQAGQMIGAGGGQLMARFLFVPHHGREDAALLAKEAISWLVDRGHEALVLQDDAEPTGLLKYAVPTIDGARPDLAVSLGGDGTMLRTLDLVCGEGIPVLGVNIGHLGYLTEIEPEQLTTALERFLKGEYHVEERMTLDVTVTSAAAGDPTKSTLALSRQIAVNEVVVEKESGNTVRLQAVIDGKPFLSYAVDGMIVATPTGSTAYNLSARGPILSPSLHAMLMTPVSAHMLFDRAMVLHEREVLDLTNIGPRDASVVVDGRHVATIATGGSVRCMKSDRPALIVTFRERDFREVLKSKFGLTDR